MKRKLNVKNLLFNVLAGAMILGMSARALGPILTGILAALMVIAAFAPAPEHMNGVTMNGISREVWESYIEENLFPDESFLNGMMDDSEYVDYKIVHIPQAGGTYNVQKNRTLDGTQTQGTRRTDTTVDYYIDEYTSDPFIIVDAEKVELSYNKMDSVLYEQKLQLRRVIAENIMYSIAPTGTATLADGVTINNNILRSTGYQNNDAANAVSALAYTPGATGNRLKFTVFDLKQAQNFLDKQDMPEEDRYVLASADAIQQLVDDLIATKYRGSLNDVYDTKTGNVTKLLGFTFYKRSKGMVYNNAATPVRKAVGAAGAADDNDAIIFWQKSAISKAIGDVHVFETLNDARSYGDLYSCLVRMGASKRRYTEVGVGAIVQSAAA